MYLSRVQLDIQNHRVRRDLADLHEMHRTVMSCLPPDLGESARAGGGVLWRLERPVSGRQPVLLVQSALPPDWSRLPVGYSVDRDEGVRSLEPLLGILRPGLRFRFRLCANPTRKIDTKSGPDGKRRHGRRVPVRGDDGCLAWLIRKAAQAGFSVGGSVEEASRAVVVRQLGDARGRRGGDERPITLRAVQFDGVLTVHDPELLRAALDTGVGPGRAFGCGLLSLAPM